MAERVGTVKCEKFYSAKCGQCHKYEDDYDPPYNLAAAIKRFRRAGWRQHPTKGWLCPGCATKAASAAAE